MNLHIGGVEPKEGWSILNISPGPSVDFLGNCTDLSVIESNSCGTVYASHVLEHLGYDNELPKALSEIFRVLRPKGKLLLSVPDLDILCRQFLDPSLPLDARVFVMRMIYGGRVDEHDVHKTGFNFEIMRAFLEQAGFSEIKRTKEFDLFQDTSRLRFNGAAISLNVIAIKPSAS